MKNEMICPNFTLVRTLDKGTVGSVSVVQLQGQEVAMKQRVLKRKFNFSLEGSAPLFAREVHAQQARTSGPIVILEAWITRPQLVPLPQVASTHGLAARVLGHCPSTQLLFTELMMEHTEWIEPSLASRACPLLGSDRHNHSEGAVAAAELSTTPTEALLPYCDELRALMTSLDRVGVVQTDWDRRHLRRTRAGRLVALDFSHAEARGAGAVAPGTNWCFFSMLALAARPSLQAIAARPDANDFRCRLRCLFGLGANDRLSEDALGLRLQLSAAHAWLQNAYNISCPTAIAESTCDATGRILQNHLPGPVCPVKNGVEHAV